MQDNGTTTTNSGTFTVEPVAGSVPAGSLALSGGSAFADNAGTLVDRGTMTLNDGAFTQSGGVESGNAVQLSNSGSLVDSAGTGSFDLINDEALSGTIPAGQTVTVLGTPGNNSVATLASPGVTNNGTLILDTQSGGGYADINGSLLTNNGTFETVNDGTNTDYIEAPLTNSQNGTVTIAAPATHQDEATTTTNKGTFDIASTGGLALTGTASFTDSAGTLVNSGAMTVSSGTFTQSGGVESGNPVVLSNSSSLVDSAGAGSFDLINDDALSGTIPTGQTVTVLGTPGNNSIATLATPGVTNNGKLILDTEAGGGYADINGGLLTNNGTLQTVKDGSNNDYIEASVTNATGGTVTIASPTTSQDESTTTTNHGTFSVVDGGAITLTGGAAFTQSSTGTFSAAVDATNGVFGLKGGTDTIAGTLVITTVGSPTLGSPYNVISGAASLAGTFSALRFGPHAYVIGYSSSAVTATVATPFSLTGKNITPVQDIPNARIMVASGTNGSQAGPVYTATINLGDGSASTAGSLTTSGTTFSIYGSHVYTTPGVYTLTTTLSDQLGTTKVVTSHATVAAAPVPTATSVSPQTVGQGASKYKLTVTGTGLTDNTAVSFSNPGISVASFTWKSSTSVVVSVSVTAVAAVGPTDVTVTTPGGSGTCSGCLIVFTGPHVSSVSPPLVPGSATTVTVTGTGFTTGLTVSTNITGATVGAASDFTGTSFQVTITVPAGTAAGTTYHLIVTNPDGGKVTYGHLSVS